MIYGSGDTDEPGLRALPFSRATLEPTGEAFPIAEDGQFASVARDGTLVYLDDVGSSAKTLVWRNRAGEILETIGQPQPTMYTPALSPDGRRAAVASNADIWVHDLSRSTATRLTFEPGTEMAPSWSPSGREISYWHSGIGSLTEYRLQKIVADGSGEPVVLTRELASDSDWSPDGRYLVYSTGRDIRYVQLEPNGVPSEPIDFLSTAAREHAPTFSPDGRFLAYISDQSGRKEVYVRPFPGGAGTWQASFNGGTQPRWRSDGSELYYVEDGNTLMAISVTTRPQFALGQAYRLFQSVDLENTGVSLANYAVSADGEKFLTVTRLDEDVTASPKIRIVQNWYEEFRNREEDRRA